MSAPFPVNSVLTGVAMAYKNGKMIADEVAPKKPVAGTDFRYHKFSLSDKITMPDTRVGRKSTPNEVEFGSEEVPEFTEDHGLDDVVPHSDIQKAESIPGLDPKANAAENLADLIELGREIRTANMVFNANNYHASNKTVLSGSSKFSDASSDPVRVVSNALDGCIIRPNIATIGRAGWSVLSKHPKVLSAIKGRNVTEGIATRQEVAELFELEEILVGEAWLNLAKPGQAVSRARVWGNHLGLLYRDKLSDFHNKRPTFALTAQFGSRIAGDIDEPKTGLEGSVRVRVGEKVKELILANDMGYLFQNIA